MRVRRSKQEQIVRCGIKAQRLKADWNDDYLCKVLTSCTRLFRNITGKVWFTHRFIINENIYYIFDNSKQLCYNTIKKKSKHTSLSSNRTSFGISLLLYLPSNATEHPLCRFDEEPGLRQRCSASAETTPHEQP